MSDLYLAFVLLGTTVGAALFAFAWQRVGLRLDLRLAAFCLGTIASGLAGARGYILLEQWRNGAIQPGWLDGGFRLPGGVLGLLVGLVVWRRVFLPTVSLARIADLGAMTAPFGLAVVRFGCLVAGCCFGTVTALPWAMRFARDTQAASVHEAMHLIGRGDLTSLPVHPLAVYFMLLHVAVGGFLIWFRRRQTYDGQLVLLGLLLGQGGKALLETFRQPIPAAPALHLGAVEAAIATAAALGLLLMARRTSAALIALPGRHAAQRAVFRPRHGG
jgi:phosphatidylglycerol:prolipoprotein diacylglycerol transferase